MSEAIAIVGLSCVYPDARTPAELWENVLAQRRAFRRIPSQRLRAEDYLSEDRNAPDRTYSAEAAVIEGYEFDRVAYRVVGSTYRSADLAHWLALDVAAQALADAGFPDGEGLTRDTTGVVLGNTLTGEFSRANVLRLRWPYVRRVIEAALAGENWDPEKRRDFVGRLEAQFKAPFPPVGEETLAGGLSNTIAGRICNQFDLKGGGYTIDGACASSLLAVANACSSLVAGDLDVALAGGVDLSLDPFELVGFAKTGALAPDLMRVYDARSAGFWPGEGCGFAVLMRLSDALALGRRIYALIRGWGISSDGSGGITRPEIEGQLQALRRAYRRAGFGIETVSYFEGHGTGTNVGDATELKVISRARRERTTGAPPAAIGSIKANIGHTKAAAGIAGLIKATMAVHTQTIPPTTGCERTHPEFSDQAPALRVLREPELWPRDHPLRTGVSAMGFGGINTHIVLEGISAERRKSLTARERRLSNSVQDAELFLLGALNPDGLRKQVDHLLTFAGKLSRSELTDLAAEMERNLGDTKARAAVVASSPAELQNRLALLQSWLAAGMVSRLDLEAGVFLSLGTSIPRIGFLFPGQGSPANLTGGIFCRRFDFVRELYARSVFPAQSDGIATEVAQPALVTASLAGLRVLSRLGLTAAVSVGHSLGEMTALHWAGAFGEEGLIRIATVRGKAMAELGSPTGTMVAIAAPWKEVDALLNGDPVSIVGFNSPRQTVISGETAAVTSVADRARARGLRAVNLSVSHAFHTPLVAAAAPVLAEQLAREAIEPPRRRVISTVTGAALPAEEDLRTLLCRQVTSPVRFIDAVTAAAEQVDLFIEVGPGEVLTGLTADFVRGPVVALDAGGSSLKGWLRAAGAAFALGAPINHAALFEGRFTRPFNLDWKPTFFTNPCELAPVSDSQNDSLSESESGAKRLAAMARPAPQTDLSEPASRGSDLGLKPSAIEIIRQLVAQRAELPAAAVKDDSRMLSDLHLNSISVGQLVIEAARQMGLPPLVEITDFANATLAGMARALEELAQMDHSSLAKRKKQAHGGVDSWIHPFTVEVVERPLTPARPQQDRKPGAWQVFAAPGHPLASSLPRWLAEAGGGGVVVCLPPQLDPSPAAHRPPQTALEEDCVKLLLRGASAVLMNRENARFVLVQHGCGAGGFARSLHLEAPEIVTCLIDVPPDHPKAAEWIMAEISAATDFSEARYDGAGRRFEPRLRLLPMPGGPTDQWPLTANDVLLVTGGGKGIAAECALALGKKTGARLALLGRSEPAADAELAANLERIAAAGIHCRYVAADVTDADAVRAAIVEAERELGPISALLHGAGANVPQLLSTLDENAFQRTLAPKIQGVRNVLAAIDPDRLRLFITFGSIIGRAGLQGESDYAVANEWLTHLTKRFHKEHPHCRCLAVEWSVWSGVGMGQRLGRVDALLQQGITPIPPDRGVEILLRLLARPLPAVSVVVTGRFGELPTLKLDKAELPFLRFLEQPNVFYPGVELVVDAVLSPETDPYLDDHVYHGERLFPAVMGLEAMAQVAMALAGSSAPPSFEDVKLHRPVVVPRSRKLAIRLAALVRRPDEIEVVLRSEETGFQANHFQATCRFESAPTAGAALAEQTPSSPADPAKQGADFSSAVTGPNRPAVELDPASDLYRDLLFHTGRFQRVQQYRLLRAKECVVQVEPDAEAIWFGQYLPQDRVLGDTGVRDAAIHAIQACIPHARLLPVAVRRIVIGKIPCLLRAVHSRTELPRLLLHAREQSHDGDTFTYDLELRGEDGSVLEKWEGLILRKVEPLARQTPWTQALLGPYIERRLEELLADVSLSVALERNGQSERPASSDEAIHALGINSVVRRRPDGKPEVLGTETVSVAHAGDLTLAVAGPGPIGCDLEVVSSRPIQVWKELLGPERSRLAEVISSDSSEDADTAATRVWVASECLKKAGAMINAPLVITSVQKDGWVLLASGPLRIATHVTEIRGFQHRWAIGVLARSSG